MRHGCKDMSQGIHPEPSDEVRREGKKGKKKKEQENAAAYFQTDVAQPWPAMGSKQVCIDRA